MEKTFQLDSLEHRCRSIVDDGLPQTDSSQQSRETLGLVGLPRFVGQVVDGADRGGTIAFCLDPWSRRGMTVFREGVEILVELAETLPEGHVKFLPL